MPLDTTHLDRALRAQIAPPIPAWRRVLRPIAAVAASLLLIAVVSFAFFQNRSVQASADLMAQMHRDIVAGRVATVRVDSVADLNDHLAAFSADLKLNAVPESHKMVCCMRDLGDKKVICVQLNDGSTPVTVTIADTDAVKMPASPMVLHNGQEFHVQSVGELNMVMTDREHHRICLIGELSADKLMTLSEGVKF